MNLKKQIIIIINIIAIIRAGASTSLLLVMLLHYHNSVNYKIFEYDWLLTALIYGLIGCFRVQTIQFDLSDYKHLQLDRPNRTVNQPITIKHCMPLANKL